jgi:DNA-binding transcriptional LysR family regulator
MADLNDIAVFVRVAQFGSFSRAAHALGMPVSTVSRKVTALEERLGVTLLRRTTRSSA